MRLPEDDPFPITDLHQALFHTKSVGGGNLTSRNRVFPCQGYSSKDCGANDQEAAGQVEKAQICRMNNKEAGISLH